MEFFVFMKFIWSKQASLFAQICSDAGDIESMPFIEALGQFSYRVGKVLHFRKNNLKHQIN